MLRFFTVLRLALNPNLIFEIGSNEKKHFIAKNVFDILNSYGECEVWL